MRSSGKMHEGVDIMYRRLPNESASLPNGTQNYYMPSGTPALAAGPGIVSISKDITTGGYVQIDHGDGTKTQYMHLAPRAVSAGQRVIAGDKVGTIGYDTRPDGYKLMHLHFELLINNSKVDPAPHVNAWPQITGPSFFATSNLMPILFVVGAGLLTYYYISD